MDWFRWWHETVNDEKLRFVSDKIGRPVIEVIGAWAYILEFASKNDERGSLEGIDLERAAFVMGTTHEIFSSIYSGLCDIGIISENHLSNWERRQPKREDDSSERVRKYREKKRKGINNENCDAVKRTVTQCNAPDTDTEQTREEKSKTRARENEDRVFLDQVVESFQEILPELVPAGGVKISATLKKQILARRRERADRKQVEWWAEYWRSIRDRPFLMGQTKEGFLAGIVFLTRKSKMDAVLSGEYRGKSQVSRPPDQGLADKDYTQGAERWNQGPVQ